ncbi:MAG TPA: hypothetical protein VGF85_12060 [Opitutaceae bacterium]|jgi:hypothetical protein
MLTLRSWLPLGMVAVVISLVYGAGLNRNALYLSLLGAAAAVAVICLRRSWILAVILGGTAYLAIVPLRGVADLGRLFPAPRDIPGAGRYWCTALGPGETWTYHFTLAGLGRIGGADGSLFVDGRSLADLEIDIDGRPFRAASFTTSKTGMDHVTIPLPPEASGAMTVALRQNGPLTPRIFHGTEVHGREVYPDAIWLEFDKGRDRIVYEAKRTVTPNHSLSFHHDS